MTYPGRIVPVEGHAPIRGRKAWLADRSDGTRLHAGVDLAARRGTIARAPESGVIEDIAVSSPDYPARAPWTGYGPGIVLLRGDSGRWHLLSHAEAGAEMVAVGDRVEVGQPLTRISRLAHIHWEVRLSARTPRGREVVENVLDPVAWLEGRDVPFDTGNPQRCPPKLGPRTPRCCRPRAVQLRRKTARDGDPGAAAG